MTPTGNWRYSIIRFYWDDETTPSVEVPVGDFFGMGWGQYAPAISWPLRKSGQRIQLLLADAIQKKMQDHYGEY